MQGQEQKLLRLQIVFDILSDNGLEIYENTTELANILYQKFQEIDNIEYGEILKTLVLSGVSKDIVGIRELNEKEPAIINLYNEYVQKTNLSLQQIKPAINLLLAGLGIKPVTKNNKRETILEDYEIDDEGSLVKYHGKSTNILLPNTIIKIEKEAFLDCTTLEVVEMPDTIEELKSRIFFGCTNLKAVKISTEVKIITWRAFENCVNLMQVVLPPNLTEIRFGAFLDCVKLQELLLPESVVTIGQLAFKGCTSLVHLPIPYCVQEIPRNAVYGCDNLSEQSQHTIQNKLVDYIQSSKTSIKSYTGIEEEVVVPEGITSIKAGSFNYALNVTKITLPKTLKTINYKLFEDCVNLKELVIQSYITKISHRAFKNCVNLEEIYFPNSLQHIARNAIDNCPKLSQRTIEALDGMFIDFDYNTKGIITKYVGLDEVVELPYGMVELYKHLFFDCQIIKKVIIPDTVSVIGKGAFKDCENLEEVVIPDSVTEIHGKAFYNCTNLAKVVLPPNVNLLEDDIFELSPNNQ